MFSIAIFLLIVLFPVLIPVSVHAIHAIAEASQRRREWIANSLGDGVGSIGGKSIARARSSGRGQLTDAVTYRDHCAS